MREIQLGDYICRQDHPADIYLVDIGEAPVHVTMEIQTPVSADGLTQVVGLCGSPRWGVHATTPHRQVELDNKGGIQTGGIQYDWGMVYEVTISYSRDGLLIDWANESRWLEVGRGNPPITQVVFGLPPKRDGTYTAGWGPPLGWIFRNRLLTIFDEQDTRFEWTRPQHERMLTALINAQRDLEARVLEPARRKIQHVIDRMETAL